MPRNYKRKLESQHERLVRELFVGIDEFYGDGTMESFLLDGQDFSLRRSSEPEPPQECGVPSGVKRFLGFLAKRNLVYAYAFILVTWLQKHYVGIPDDLFRHIFRPGSGKPPSKKQLELGRKAQKIQLRKILESLEPDLEKALQYPASKFASAIAKELIPEDYEQNRERARSTVIEAIQIAKDRLLTPMKAAGRVRTKRLLDQIFKS
jgi:hypothetical protein